MNEVYYVIFRLGGPLYDLLEKIVTNRRIVYPVIIDLGDSIESGSRQPKPIIVRESDFLTEINREKE